MANISVTYTFSNSTTSDATQVNQNFTDIINGTSDGTKDFSISALTCAGNVTFNGNTTIGNSSSDDLTVTASLASSIPIKTTNTYDIGSSTKGLRYIYFGDTADSNTLKIQGQAVSSDVTLTLPSYTGTLANIPGITAAKTTTYSIAAADEIVRVDASSGSFTVTLPTAAGVTGKIYQIKRTDQTLANYVTIATTSSQTIDGVTTRKLCTQYEEFTVISDGSNWLVRSHTYPSVATSYTPSTDGLGTVSDVTATWQRIGGSLFGIIKLTSGTPTATSIALRFPSGVTSSLGAVSIVGYGGISASNAASYLCICGNAYDGVNVGIQNGSNNGLTPLGGSSVAVNGMSLSFSFGPIPITNWEG